MTTDEFNHRSIIMQLCATPSPLYVLMRTQSNTIIILLLLLSSSCGRDCIRCRVFCQVNRKRYSCDLFFLRKAVFWSTARRQLFTRTTCINNLIFLNISTPLLCLRITHVLYLRRLLVVVVFFFFVINVHTYVSTTAYLYEFSCVQSTTTALHDAHTTPFDCSRDRGYVVEMVVVPGPFNTKFYCLITNIAGNDGNVYVYEMCSEFKRTCTCSLPSFEIKLGTFFNDSF